MDTLEQPVKFYQTGTFTVGNRLLADDQRSVQASMHRTNSLNSGHRACQGCGEALGARYAIDAAMVATGNQLIAVNATGCLEVFSTPYPETSWQIPWIHSLFGNAAAVASGVAAAQRALGRENVRVIDPAPAVAKQVKRLLEAGGAKSQISARGEVNLYTSGDVTSLKSLLPKLLGEDSKVERVEWRNFGVGQLAVRRARSKLLDSREN